MIWTTFYNFFHQLLMLWIIHVVLSLMSRLVHVFSWTMLSFVSTSSFVFPQVLRSQSGCCQCFASRTQPSSTLAHHRLQHCASPVKRIHHCLLLRHAVSGFNRPVIDSFRIFQTCNRPTIDLLPDFTNSFSNSFDSSSRFVRFENHAEFGYLTPF